MGKGDRRGKTQTKPLAEDLGLAPVRRRAKQGRARMQELKTNPALSRREDPTLVALKARARMMGTKDLNAMRSQALGEPAGRAIYLRYEGSEAAELWDVYAGLTAAEARYAKIVLGVPIQAKVAKIEYLPERLETGADDDPDLRTEDERHRDAVNSWIRWRGLIQQLSAGEQTAIWAVVRGRAEPVHEGSLTRSGGRFLEALAAMRPGKE